MLNQSIWYLVIATDTFMSCSAAVKTLTSLTQVLHVSSLAYLLQQGYFYRSEYLGEGLTLYSTLNFLVCCFALLKNIPLGSS